MLHGIFCVFFRDQMCCQTTAGRPGRWALWPTPQSRLGGMAAGSERRAGASMTLLQTFLGLLGSTSPARGESRDIHVWKHKAVSVQLFFMLLQVSGRPPPSSRLLLRSRAFLLDTLRSQARRRKPSRSVAGGSSPRPDNQPNNPIICLFWVGTDPG